jgi:hypothetical protein
MNSHLLSPPYVYLVIALVVVAIVLVRWKGKALVREVRRWRLSELIVGPLKFARRAKSDGAKNASARGVEIGTGARFRGVSIKRVTGRDSGVHASGTSDESAVPGVRIGDHGVFEDTEIEDISGRDQQQERG